MTYLSPYPGGMTPKDLDDWYYADEIITCPICQWKGIEDSAVERKQVIPACGGRLQRIYYNFYCPECDCEL